MVTTSSSAAHESNDHPQYPPEYNPEYPSAPSTDLTPSPPSIPPLSPDVYAVLGKAANAIRQLSMEAVQKANSGHPGLPMGCAELGAYMYGITLKHSPKNPHWLNRDRMVLSAGHGFDVARLLSALSRLPHADRRYRAVPSVALQNTGSPGKEGNRRRRSHHRTFGTGCRQCSRNGTGP